MELSGWQNGKWKPLCDISIGMHDLGFMQGVVIVDRLRTIAGTPLDIDLHVHRFHDGCRAVGVELPSSYDLSELISSCCVRNQEAFPAVDFSIVTLATPGPSGIAYAQPTVIVHPTAIAWPRLRRWYSRGQALETSSHRNVPEACWSPEIKTRARLQYYLADREVANRNDDDAAALLLDIDGGVTETSAANVCIVEGRKLISPPMDRILHGVSLARTLRLARRAGLKVVFETFGVERAEKADALLLSGSTGCVWPASRLNGCEFSSPCDQPVYVQLLDMWKEDLGFDFSAAAISATQ